MENDVLQQILGELKDLKAGQAEMRRDIISLRGDVSDLKAGQAMLQQDVIVIRNDSTYVRQAAFSLEQNYGEKIGIALDMVIAHTDKFAENDGEHARMEHRIDRLDLEQHRQAQQLEKLAQ